MSVTPDENGACKGAGESFVPGELIPAYTACGFTNGAYLDTVCQENEGIVRFQKGSEAVFRYLCNPEPAHMLELYGRGEGFFQLEADGVVVGNGKAGEVIAVSLEPGGHELRLRMLTEGNYELRSFCLK